MCLCRILARQRPRITVMASFIGRQAIIIPMRIMVMRGEQ
jgi:hypothetical protein